MGCPSAEISLHYQAILDQINFFETTAALNQKNGNYIWAWKNNPPGTSWDSKYEEIKGTYETNIAPLAKLDRDRYQGDENYSLEKGQDSLTGLLPLFKKERWIFPFEEKGASFDRRRLGPHLLAYFSQKAKDSKEAMNPEKVKDLLALSSVKEMQILATLGYFKKRLSLFENKEMRTLFLSLLAEPPLLVQELKIGQESFAKELAQFAKEGYRQFENLNQPEIASYFLDLSRYFNKSIRYVLPHANIDFLDSKKELKARIAQEGIDSRERTAHLLDLAAHLEPDSLESDDAADLLIAHAASHLFPHHADHPLYSKSEITNRKNHLIRFQSRLNQLLSSLKKIRS